MVEFGDIHILPFDGRLGGFASGIDPALPAGRQQALFLIVVDLGIDLFNAVYVIFRGFSEMQHEYSPLEEFRFEKSIPHRGWSIIL